MRVFRRIVPHFYLPLCMLASILAAAPWLRSFPLSVAGAPLYGAAVLSVLMPVVVARIRIPPLWLAIVVDILLFAVFTLAVVLQSVSDVRGLLSGLYRGPSQVLTFALPLVSPRTLMVAPVALIWFAGASAGQCIARRWYTMLPYVGFVVAFGLAYAATQRAVGSDPSGDRTRDTLLAAGLLVTLLLMRVTQTWVRQDETAESTQADGVLPMRGLIIGMVTTLAVVLVVSLVVQSDVFPKRAKSPQRVPTVDNSRPLTPLSFIAGLRPQTARDATALFTVRINKPAPGYFAIANVDVYDGSGWSFERTFRPSGGVLPADTDTDLRSTETVNQQYRIAGGALAAAPWMPFLYRARDVTGASVNIDPSSGMIVPASDLSAGSTYTVQSALSPRTFAQLRASSQTADTSTPAVNTELPGALRTTLDRLVSSFATETGVPSSPALPFLQALLKDLRSQYSLSGAAQGSASGTVGTSTPTASSKSAAASSSSASAAADLAGGTGFADVLASIRGTNRNGTPEQFATLVALVARDLGVPARIVTGFRVPPKSDATDLAAGQYTVTTADAWTWVEVPVLGAGWVVLDGTPNRFSSGVQPTASGTPRPSSSAPPSQNALVTQGASGHAVAPKSNTRQPSAGPGNGVLIAIVIAVVALILILLLILLARKPVRTARRRRPTDPRERLLGAWQEGLDVLVEAGLPGLTALTSSEIADLTTEQFGAQPGGYAAELGTAANSVIYSTTAIQSADADAAWDNARALRRSVRDTLGVRGKVSARLRYHRPSRASAVRAAPVSWASSAAAERNVSLGAAEATRRGRRRGH